MSSLAGLSTVAPPYELPSAKDEIRRVKNLSADYPSPTHPVHEALLSSVSLSADSADIYAFSRSGVIVHPQGMTTASEVDPEVSLCLIELGRSG